MGNRADDHEELLKRISQSLEHAAGKAATLKRRNTFMISAGLVAGAVGTILAGLASARGPLAGQGAGAWKVTCGLIGVLTACATLLPGLNQRLSIPDRLVKASACIGRLRALEIAITLG